MPHQNIVALLQSVADNARWSVGGLPNPQCRLPTANNSHYGPV